MEIGEAWIPTYEDDETVPWTQYVPGVDGSTMFRNLNRPWESVVPGHVPRFRPALVHRVRVAAALARGLPKGSLFSETKFTDVPGLKLVLLVPVVDSSA